MKQHEEGREEDAHSEEQHRDALSISHLADDCTTPAAAEPDRRRSVGEGLLRLSATGLAHGERIWHSFLFGSSVWRDHLSWRGGGGVALGGNRKAGTGARRCRNGDVNGDGFG